MKVSLEKLFQISNSTGWIGEDSRLTSHLLISVHSGVMEVDCSLGKLQLNPNETLCLPKGDLRQAKCITDSFSTRMRWKGMPPPRAKGILNLPARVLLDNLMKLRQNKAFPRKALEHLLTSLVLTLGQGGIADVKTGGRKSPYDFQPWIDEALKGKSNISDGARSMNMTPDHFTRVFKSQYGLSPKKWLLEERFSLAIQWIEEDGLKTGEVVKALGLEDVSLFCLQFRKRFGCSPGMWKIRPGRSLRS